MESAEIIKEIKKMVKQATELQRQGNYEEGLNLLNEAEKRTEVLLEPWERKSIFGIIFHFQGRILQAMKRYDEALEKLYAARELRKDDPIQFGYSSFQLFICLDYASRSVEEIKASVKKDLWKMADASKDSKQLGDIFQNMAYIYQRCGDIEKAIWFYNVSETFRRISNDRRGFALTWARLGECFKEIGDGDVAKAYGNRALKYFKKKGDVERIQQIKKNVL